MNYAIIKGRVKEFSSHRKELELISEKQLFILNVNNSQMTSLRDVIFGTEIEVKCSVSVRFNGQIRLTVEEWKCVK